MPRNEADPDYPCPSAYAWQAGRADSGSAEHLNIICGAADVVIATNVPAAKAIEIIAAHNGEG